MQHDLIYLLVVKHIDILLTHVKHKHLVHIRHVSLIRKSQ